MAKQTIYLFVKALIIGLLLNLGIQQVSEASLAQRQETIIPQPTILTHSPVTTELTFQNK